MSTKTFSRKWQVRKRYGGVCSKTIDRWVEKERIPPPDFYSGQVGFWSDDKLDKADREASKESRKPGLNRGLKEYLDRRKAKVGRKSVKESIRA
jgi:hypothetical protein